MRGHLLVSFFIIYYLTLTITHCHPFANKKAIEKSIAFGNKRYKAGKAMRWDKKPIGMTYDSNDNLYMLCTDSPTLTEAQAEGQLEGQSDGEDEGRADSEVEVDGGMPEMYVLKKGEEKPVKLEGMPEANITEFDIGENDNVYMATNDGVYKYDPATEDCMLYALAGENITGIYIDHNSTLYVQEAETSNVYTLNEGKKVPFKKIPKCDTMIISKDNTIYTMTNGTIKAMKENAKTPTLIGEFDPDEVLGMYVIDITMFIFLTEGVVYSRLQEPTRFRLVENVQTPICMAQDSRNNLILSFWFDDLTSLILIQ